MFKSQTPTQNPSKSKNKKSKKEAEEAFQDLIKHLTEFKSHVKSFVTNKSESVAALVKQDKLQEAFGIMMISPSASCIVWMLLLQYITHPALRRNNKSNKPPEGFTAPPGTLFEYFCHEILEQVLGTKIVHTGKSGDFGIDMKFPGFVCQCKNGFQMSNDANTILNALVGSMVASDVKNGMILTSAVSVSKNVNSRIELFKSKGYTIIVKSINDLLKWIMDKADKMKLGTLQSCMKPELWKLVSSIDDELNKLQRLHLDKIPNDFEDMEELEERLRSLGIKFK